MITVLNTDYVIETTTDYDVQVTIPSFECPIGTTLLVIESSYVGAVNHEVSYNGNLAQSVLQTVNAYSYTTIWYIQNPGIVTDDIVLQSLGESSGRRVCAYAISGTPTVGSPVDSTAEYNFDVSEGISTEIITNTDGCLIIDGVTTYSVIDPVGSETVVYIDDSADTLGGSQYFLQTTAGSKFMTWFWQGENSTAHTLVAFKADVPAANNNNQFLLFFK